MTDTAQNSNHLATPQSTPAVMQVHSATYIRQDTPGFFITQQLERDGQAEITKRLAGPLTAQGVDTEDEQQFALFAANTVAVYGQLMWIHRPEVSGVHAHIITHLFSGEPVFAGEEGLNRDPRATLSMSVESMLDEQIHDGIIGITDDDLRDLLKEIHSWTLLEGLSTRHSTMLVWTTELDVADAFLLVDEYGETDAAC